MVERGLPVPRSTPLFGQSTEAVKTYELPIAIFLCEQRYGFSRVNTEFKGESRRRYPRGVEKLLEPVRELQRVGHLLFDIVGGFAHRPVTEFRSKRQVIVAQRELAGEPYRRSEECPDR